MLMLESQEYKNLLTSYRFIMGLLAVLFNGFFIHVLMKFPIRDNSGYYTTTRRLVKYLFFFDMMYGLFAILQISILVPAESSFDPQIASHQNITRIEFLETETPIYSTIAKILGIGRLCMVRGIIMSILFMTVTRFCFTAFPIKSMRLICVVGRVQSHAVLITISIIFMLIKINSYLKGGNFDNVSACSGLLLCENQLSESMFQCYDVSAIKAVSATGSLLICGVILILMMATWNLASRKDKLMKDLLKISANYQSKNIQAVKASVGISTTFLICNSGPIINNIIKLTCRAFSLQLKTMERLQKSYFVADVLEQWLLPTMTVVNCLVVVLTSKKMGKFLRWHLTARMELCGDKLRRREDERRGRVVTYVVREEDRLQIRRQGRRKKIPMIVRRFQFFDNSFSV